LRVDGTDKHFGNPFSSDAALVKKDNLIQTSSTKESVEKYIDWILNSDNIVSTTEALAGNFGKDIQAIEDRFGDFNDNIAEQVIGLGGGKYAKIETRLISDITGAVKVATGKDKNYLTEIIRKEGQKNPILIRENGEIIEGRHRLQALKNIGSKTIKVVVLLNNNSEEVRLHERREWIRSVLQSGILKGKPIIYYKELNEPSHANALDFLINKYDWNTKSTNFEQETGESSTECFI